MLRSIDQFLRRESSRRIAWWACGIMGAILVISVVSTLVLAPPCVRSHALSPGVYLAEPIEGVTNTWMVQTVSDAQSEEWRAINLSIYPKKVHVLPYIEYLGSRILCLQYEPFGFLEIGPTPGFEDGKPPMNPFGRQKVVFHEFVPEATTTYWN